MRDQIDTLFNKEMTRKEFLQHVGSGILILFGISGLLNALAGQQKSGQRTQSMGYGTSAYGGTSKR